MHPLVHVALGAVLVVLVCFLLLGRRRRRWREALLREPLPEEWIAVLEKNVRIYRRLPSDLKSRLHGYVQLFLAEKAFEACGGLEEVTDEMRVTIAGQACLLLLSGRNGTYADLHSILVYPEDFVPVRRSRWGPGDGGFEGFENLWDEGDPDEALLGESWNTGSVLLSWASVLEGARSAEDGVNVVLHEFAHQLDQINGDVDGAPGLGDAGRQARWAKVMKRAYERHGFRTRRGRRTAMDPYGATDPGEFFAVATEAFFENPRALRREDAALYGELREYFAVDPAKWEG